MAGSVFGSIGTPFATQGIGPYQLTGSYNPVTSLPQVVQLLQIVPQQLQQLQQLEWAQQQQLQQLQQLIQVVAYQFQHLTQQLAAQGAASLRVPERTRKSRSSFTTRSSCWAERATSRSARRAGA